MEEIETPLQVRQNPQSTATGRDDAQRSPAFERSLLILNFVMMIVSACGSPLLLRLYFVRGGKLKWLSSWLQTAGWPILLVPIAVSGYYRRRRTNPTRDPTISTKPCLMTKPLLLASVATGVILGANCFLYSYGNSCLPVSTVALLSSTQLGFNAFFSFVMVKQRFTVNSINAVVLLSLGVVVLGIHSDDDRPEGESRGMYYLGFFMMLGAAVTFGLALPSMELGQRKAKVAMSYALVVEMRLIIAVVANVFSTIGMMVNKDFQAIAMEAKKYELGEARYYSILIWTAIVAELSGLGIIGSIFYSSSLLVGIIQTALIPVIQVLALIFFHDPFNGDKGVALALSLWGSASYFYGEYKAKQDTIHVN